MTAEMVRTEFRPEEWWNGDTYLARIIGSMALLHRDIGNTHPESVSPDEWKSILTRIGEPLIAYAQDCDLSEGDKERRMAAKTALELFANWFDHFWD